MFWRWLNLFCNYEEGQIFKKKKKNSEALFMWSLHQGRKEAPATGPCYEKKSTYLFVDILLCVSDMNK
jgi:hypothetical protein